MHTSIKTHDSESQGKEEAGLRDEQLKLFTRSTTVKLASTLNKPS